MELSDRSTTSGPTSAKNSGDVTTQLPSRFNQSLRCTSGERSFFAKRQQPPRFKPTSELTMPEECLLREDEQTATPKV